MGMAEGSVDMEMIDEGLKSELQKQGIYTTTLQELYN